MKKGLKVIDEREIMGQTIRICGDFENPLFLAKDVAEWIDYAFKDKEKGIRNVNMMLRSVDSDEKVMAKFLPSGQSRSMWFLTEDGFYEVCMQSTKPNAKIFKKEVKKILKSIRKTGMYIRDDVWQEIMNDPKRFGELLIDYAETKKEKEKLQLENSQQKQLIAEYEPKATYCDLVLESPNAVPISLIAKDYGMSAIAFNKLLHDLGIQYKQSGTWLLYQEYAGFGYTKSSTYLDENTGFTKMNTKWTQKGRLFLYETLKANDILPLIEKE